MSRQRTKRKYRRVATRCFALGRQIQQQDGASKRELKRLIRDWLAQYARMQELGDTVFGGEL
jgi:hypothetical protein